MGIFLLHQHHTSSNVASIQVLEEPPINLFNQHHTLPIMSLHYLPPVKPSAIALGTIFNHAASLAVLGPVFGDTSHRAQAANSKEEFVKSKEAASAAAAYGTSLVGSAIQSYGVGAVARIFETVGLSLFLTWWGTHTNPFE